METRQRCGSCDECQAGFPCRDFPTAVEVVDREIRSGPGGMTKTSIGLHNRTVALTIKGLRYSRFGHSRCDGCGATRLLFYVGDGTSRCQRCLEAL
jgi:hypothetical protein